MSRLSRISDPNSVSDDRKLLQAAQSWALSPLLKDDENTEVGHLCGSLGAREWRSVILRDRTTHLAKVELDERGKTWRMEFRIEPALSEESVRSLWSYSAIWHSIDGSIGMLVTSNRLFDLDETRDDIMGKEDRMVILSDLLPSLVEHMKAGLLDQAVSSAVDTTRHYAAALASNLKPHLAIQERLSELRAKLAATVAELPERARSRLEDGSAEEMAELPTHLMDTRLGVLLLTPSVDRSSIAFKPTARASRLSRGWKVWAERHDTTCSIHTDGTVFNARFSCPKEAGESVVREAVRKLLARVPYCFALAEIAQRAAAIVAIEAQISAQSAELERATTAFVRSLKPIREASEALPQAFTGIHLGELTVPETCTSKPGLRTGNLW